MASSAAPSTSSSTERSCLCGTVNAPSASPSQHASSTAKCKICRTKPKFSFLRGQRSFDLGQQGKSSAGKFVPVYDPQLKRESKVKWSPCVSYKVMSVAVHIEVHLFFNLAVDEASRARHFTSGRTALDTHWIGSCVGPSVGLEGLGKRKSLDPVRNRKTIPRSSAINLVTLPTELSTCPRFSYQA